MKTVRTGLDLIRVKWPSALSGARAGALVHPASINRRFIHAVDCLRKTGKFELKALFGPQHGIRGETQDNMIEWKGFRDRQTGLPVFSLYSKTRKPEPQMLEDIDVLIIDLQDIGARYYTFIWTMALCLEACAEMNRSVVVLDRPNPIGGRITEGPTLDKHFTSFVGLHSLPVRHGMTAGEIALFLKHEYYPAVDLYVVSMEGWKRHMWFDDTGLPWVLPSPNMPVLLTATVYPGMCLLEGTNLSEGRGTTRPFEIFGAPFIDPPVLIARLEEFKLPGVIFRPLYFEPTFQKFRGRLCGGAQIHITNRNVFRPFKTGVAVLKAVFELYNGKFRWKRPPYEYERKKLPIDILAGSERLRSGIESGIDIEAMEKWWQQECRTFNRKTRRKYLLYD